MAPVFQEQLDFIFFFYGLAFILLGAISVAIARMLGRSWLFLAGFAFLHGAGEWLDLVALASDGPAFMAVRLTLLMGSFLLLMEFARQQAGRFGLGVPGCWPYLGLVLIVVIGGLTGGLATAGALVRYCVGLVAALATSAVFARYAGELSGTARRLAFYCAGAFLLYGITAGAIAPAAPFWPASILNQGSFGAVTGVPIQLVRGILACTLAILIWSICGRLLVQEVASERYTAHLRRQYIGTIVAMVTIISLGWTLTEFLGALYKTNAQVESQSDMDLIAGRLSAETSMLDGMVRALAGAPSVLPLLTGGGPVDERRGRFVLDLNVDAAGARYGYILDRSGRVVASSSRRETNVGGAPEILLGASFEKSLAGGAGYVFAFDRESQERYYTASYAIRDDDGNIVGVAMLRRSLKRFETALAQFDRPSFFVDPNGIVVLTNRPGYRFRQLWPLASDTRSALSRRFGELNRPPLMTQQIDDAAWTTFDGKRDFLRRRYADHSQWSIVTAMPATKILANRMVGIISTLLLTMMTLMYFFGREHGVRDSVQMERRLELQELASNLRLQAATDRLTGLHNRLKFDETLAQEISRSQRYGTSFTLVLYDIDHFKQVNDLHGHQAGDRVLVQLSQTVSRHLRETDFLARWGGEEFVILIPGADDEAARLMTEKLRLAIARDTIDEVGTITCSFGIAQFVEGDTDTTLMERADAALYRAKLNGRNRIEMASRPARLNDIASVA